MEDVAQESKDGGVVYGQWIDINTDSPLDIRMECSVCGFIETPFPKWRYCPACGAKMDGKKKISDKGVN